LGIPKLLNFRFPEELCFLNCDNAKLKISLKIFFSVSERHRWAVVGFHKNVCADSVNQVTIAVTLKIFGYEDTKQSHLIAKTKKRNIILKNQDGCDALPTLEKRRIIFSQSDASKIFRKKKSLNEKSWLG